MCCGAIWRVPTSRCGRMSIRRRERDRGSAAGARVSPDLACTGTGSGSRREKLMLNELYLTVCFARRRARRRACWQDCWRGPARPTTPARSMRSMPATSWRRPLPHRLQDCDPERLGLYRVGCEPHSRVLEFLGLLLDAEIAGDAAAAGAARAGAGHRPLSDRHRNHRVSQPAGTRVAAVLGVKEYPTPTWWACTTGCCRRRSRSF